jgi:hypothetical protein
MSTLKTKSKVVTKKRKTTAKKIKTVFTKLREISNPEPLTRKTVKSELNLNTWVVFRAMSEKKPMLFNGKLSRDEVRTAYSKIMKTIHSATRSKRLKNY